MLSGLTAFLIFVAVKDLVFGVLAAASRDPSLVGGRATAMTLMAMAFALLATHVFWPFTATARMTTAAAGMARSMIRSMVGLRKRTYRDQ